MISPKQSTVLPDWRKAWKLDDPAWVKSRQNEWRRIKQSPVLASAFNQDELKKIKNFFMTGSAFDPEPSEDEWRWCRYHPDTRPLPVSHSPLLQCWLGVEQSEEHWQHIKQNCSQDRYDSTRKFFRDLLRNHFPAQGGLFDGLDERLYYFFGPTRCRPEDYPSLRHEQFLRIAWAVNNGLGSLIKPYLSTTFNPHNIAPAVLEEWCDSLLWTYEAIGPEGNGQTMHINNMVAIVKAAKSVLEKAGEYQEAQVKFAKDLLSGFRSRQLPPALSEALTPLLS